jgi:uncharacterized membrane protein YidH (DUF202 family)
VTANDRRGLQAERTALSWSRTALAALAVAAVSFKAGLEDDAPASYVAAGLAAVAALVLYGGGRERTTRPGFAAPRRVTLRLVAAVVLAAAAAAACAVVTHLLTA